MSESFPLEYLALLRRQVDEEINYLIAHGHDKTFVDIPCTFCIEHHSGKHHCRRLKDLRDFQFRVMTNLREASTNAGRRPIGSEIPPIVADTFTSPMEAPIFVIK